MYRITEDIYELYMGKKAYIYIYEEFNHIK